MSLWIRVGMNNHPFIFCIVDAIKRLCEELDYLRKKGEKKNGYK